MDIPPRQPLPVLLENASAGDQQRTQRHRDVLDFLARVESIRVLEAGETPPESATALVGDMKVLVPMAGLIDKQAELDRLDKRLAKLDAEHQGVSRKLDNPNFVDKAPADVVAKTREQLSALEADRVALTEQRARIAAL